jgi:head-tail adaptor
VVEHFAKKKKEAKTVAKQENIKSNEEMSEGKNEISVRYIDGIAVVPRHIYRVSLKDSSGFKQLYIR